MEEKERKQEYQEYIQKVCKEIRTHGVIMSNDDIFVGNRINVNVLTVLYDGQLYSMAQVNDIYYVQCTEVNNEYLLGEINAQKKEDKFEYENLFNQKKQQYLLGIQTGQYSKYDVIHMCVGFLDCLESILGISEERSRQLLADTIIGLFKKGS